MSARASNEWGVYAAATAMHVLPIDDLREHVTGPSCWCTPTYDEGLYVHHSMDNREEYERGERKSS